MFEVNCPESTCIGATVFHGFLNALNRTDIRFSVVKCTLYRNRLDPYQNVGPGLDPNCFTDILKVHVFFKHFFSENVSFESKIKGRQQFEDLLSLQNI